MVRLFKQRQSMHSRRLEPVPGVQLSFAQMKMLFHLPAEGTVTLTRYAESAAMSPAAATQALGPLEEDGLVTRFRSESDRRTVDIALSDRGHQLLATLRSNFSARWDSQVADLDDADLATAARILDTVIQVFHPD
jgi:DNA-binding MarR family transcriptional regulator